jgi:hypothetical protein
LNLAGGCNHHRIGSGRGRSVRRLTLPPGCAPTLRRDVPGRPDD